MIQRSSYIQLQSLSILLVLLMPVGLIGQSKSNGEQLVGSFNYMLVIDPWTVDYMDQLEHQSPGDQPSKDNSSAYSDQLHFKGPGENYAPFIQALCEHASQGNLQVKAADIFGEMSDSTLTSDSIKAFLTNPDAPQIQGINFHQEWYYDQDNHSLMIKPLHLALTTTIGAENDDFKGLSPQFYLKFNNPSGDYGSPQGDLLYAPQIAWAGRLGMFSLINSMEHVSFPGYERHFRSPGQYGYSGIRWSTFNREYLSFEELKSYRHHDLGDVLFQELAKGNLLAYQDEELEKLTKPEKEENYLIIQLDEPIKKVGTCNAIILPEAKVESKDINALNIRQEWYYDAEKGELSSKVISIALMVKEYNYEERQLHFHPIVWVAFPETPNNK